MLTLLALLGAPALATPTVGDCGNVPGTFYDYQLCQNLCVIQTHPDSGLQEVFCDSGRDHVAAGAAIDGNGGGYSTTDTADAEYVILGADNAFAAGGVNRFCCSVQDDAFELWIVRLNGTEDGDEYRFKAPSAAFPGLDLFNPDASGGHVIAGIIEAGAGDDVIFGSSTNTPDDYWEYLFGEDDDDEIMASYGDDWLDGGLGLDILKGEGNDDVLKGREDNDTLNGGAGDDILIGATGNDTLLGGVNDDCLQPEPPIANGGSGATSDVVTDNSGANTLDMPGTLTISSITMTGASDECTNAADAQAPAECESIVVDEICTVEADAWEDAHQP